MTRDYAINKTQDLKTFKSGDKVQAMLFVRGDQPWLEDIALKQTSDEAIAKKSGESVVAEKALSESKRVSCAPFWTHTLTKGQAQRKYASG